MRAALFLPWVLLGACQRTPGPAPSVSSSAAAPEPQVQAADAAETATAALSAATRAVGAPPRVDLRGRAAQPVDAALPSGRVRLYPRLLRVPVLAEPRPGAKRLGYLRVGSSVVARDEPRGRQGCPGGWLAVEPAGFVCQGREATTDPADPLVRATTPYPPDVSRRLPFIYGTVRKPGPVYRALPTEAELAAAEPDLLKRMDAWLDAPGEIGASYAQHVWLGRPGEDVGLLGPAGSPAATPPLLGPAGSPAATPPDARAVWNERRTEGVPDFLQPGVPPPRWSDEGEGPVAERMKARVGTSFLTTFLYQGRRYGLGTDLRVVPTDRYRPIQGSAFHGFEIGTDVRFPFAIVRREDARAWRLERPGNKLVEARALTYRTAFDLTGKQQFFRGRLHYETVQGDWVSDRDVSRLDPIKRMPKWGKNGERWIDVNLTKQTLLLVEGERPVYATLISSGEAGLEDSERTTATKRGIFRIHTKHLAVTMDSDQVGEEFELRDVPYVQYFDDGGHALHAAYWHDRFGVPKSHGCINLSPEDARRIFFWTEPRLPEGWHGVETPLTGTVLFVHP